MFILLFNFSTMGATFRHLIKSKTDYKDRKHKRNAKTFKSKTSIDRPSLFHCIMQRVRTQSRKHINLQNEAFSSFLMFFEQILIEVLPNIMSIYLHQYLLVKNVKLKIMIIIIYSSYVINIFT